MIRLSRYLAVAFLLLLPSVLAAAPATVITDPADASVPSLDIRSLTVSSDANAVTFQLKVTDLSQPSPVADSSGFRHYYHVEFGLSTAAGRFYAEAQVHDVDTTSTATTDSVCPKSAADANVGTCFAGGSTDGLVSASGSASLDPSTGIVTIKLTRSSAGFNVPVGAVLTGITAKTLEGADPYEVHSAVLSPIVGGGSSVVDSAGPGSNFVS